jgi:hypothetical protein
VALARTTAIGRDDRAPATEIRTSADAGDAAGKSFWDSAWSNAKPTTYEGPVLQFSHLARKFVPDGKGKKAIELGAIPGNHLVHFHKEFGSTSLR